MTLQAQVLHFPSGRPIDQGTRSEFLKPGEACLRVENLRQPRMGALSKRDGFTSVSRGRLDGSTRTAGYKHFAFGDRTCVIDGHYIDVYTPVQDVSITKQRVPEPIHRRIPLPYPSGTPTLIDVVLAGSYFFIVTQVQVNATYNVYATVVDSSTYAIVRHDLLDIGWPTINGSVVSIAAVGTTVAIFYGAFAVSTIRGRTIAATVPGINTGWSAASSLFTDWYAGGAGGAAFDAIGLEDRFAIAYANTSAGTNKLSVRTFTTTLAASESATIATGSNLPQSVGLAGSNADTLWIAWGETTVGVRAQGRQGNALATIKATTATVTTGGIEGRVAVLVTGVGTARVVGSFFQIATPGSNMRARGIAIAGGAVTLTGTETGWNRLIMVTRPWSAGGRNYCAVVPQQYGGYQNTQKCHFVIDIDSDNAFEVARVVANISARQSILGFATIFPPSPPAHALVLDGLSTLIAIPNVVQRSYLSKNTGGGLELVLLDYASSLRWQSVDLGATTLVAGSLTAAFDGETFEEHGFLLAPDTPTLAIGAAIGPTGTNIKYALVFEKTDSAGNVAWSAPGTISAAISPVNQKVNVTCPTLQVSSHGKFVAGFTQGLNTVRIAVFRSSDNGAAPWVRVGSVDNDPFAATVFFQDDDSAATKPQIYTPPGGPAAQPNAEQVHQCPPSFLTATLYNDMVVGVADDGITLFYSAQHISGEQRWFNDVFQLELADGGPVTAFAVMDGTLFIFKRSRIFAVQGVAPTGSGSQGGLGDPRLVSADAGCIDARSIAVTAKGIFFQTAAFSFALLNRAQTVERIGQAVDQTTSAFTNCTAATVDVANDRVYFELSQGSAAGVVTGTGRALVYDLILEQWVSVDRRKDNAGIADAPAQSAAIVSNSSRLPRYSWLGVDGRLYIEDSTTALDDGRFVTPLWEPPRVRVGLQQQQRVWEIQLLAEQSSAAGIKVEVAYDASDYAPADDRVWTEAAAFGKTTFPIRPSPEHFAVGVRISETAPAVLGIGRGFTFIGMSVDLAAKQGATKGTPHGDVSMRR